MYQIVTEYGNFVQSFQKVDPWKNRALDLDPGFTKLRRDGVAGVLLPVVIDTSIVGAVSSPYVLSPAPAARPHQS
jgi:hypothetical protein